MGEKKRKRVECPRCEVKYAASRVRCPACEEPNPQFAKAALPAGDRWIGLVVLILGILFAVPVLWAFLLMPGLAIRGRLGAGALAVIPLGMILNGCLLLVGIHPRDFYAWWNGLSDIPRSSIIGLLVVLGLAFALFWFFGGGSSKD
jgi:hypothetical protein